MQRLKTDSGASSQLDQLERYLLDHVLSWKLSYTTPHDFCCAILETLAKVRAVPGATIEAVATKAMQLTHLLMLCMLFA